MNALITGASSGIGLELARLFAQDKINLILVSRDQQTLEGIAVELRKKYEIKVEVIAIDLSLLDAAKQVFEKVNQLRWQIDFLINNAGFGDFGSFIKADAEKEQSMIELNVVTLTQLCKLFIPGMVVRKEGKVLNVASVAAFVPGPFMAVYYATKAYVLSFSQAINSELHGTGVSVTVLCPGPTATNFAKTAHAESSKLFKKKLPSAKKVAQFGYAAMMKGKTVVIYGFLNRLLIFSSRFVSSKIIVFLSRKSSI
jgi:short-subunit dehydrogenase